MRWVLFNLDLMEIQGFFIYNQSKDGVQKVTVRRGIPTMPFARATLETSTWGVSTIEEERMLSQ